MKLKNRDTKTYSIAFIIIAVLVTFSVIGSVTLLVLSKNYSESALHNLADDILLRTVNDSAEHITYLLEPAVDAVGSIVGLIPQDAHINSDEERNDAIVHAMIATLERHEGVYTVYYANPEGEFFLVGKREKFKDSHRKYYFHKRITVADG